MPSMTSAKTISPSHQQALEPTTNVTLTLKIEDLVAQYLKAGRWAETDEAWVIRSSDYLLDPHKQIIQITATVDEPTQKK